MTKSKRLLFATVFSSVAINCDATLQKINNPNETEAQKLFGQTQKKCGGFDTLNNALQYAFKINTAPVFSSAAINCDAAQRGRNNLNKTEDKRIFYQIQKEIAGKEYVESMCCLADFDSLADIVQGAWNNREQEDFTKLIDYRFILEQGPELDIVFKVELCCVYSAWLCFGVASPITMNDVREIVNEFSNKFKWKNSSVVLNNLTFYLFGKTWRVAFWLDAINQLEKAKSKENATTNLRDIKGNVIKSLREELNKINNTKLEVPFLQIVSIYLETRYDFKKFKMINKKCRDAINRLHFNPLPITNAISDETVLELFPNIQTQFLWAESDRKIDIKNAYGINVDTYEIKYGFFVEYVFLMCLPTENIRFTRSIRCTYVNYITQKTRLDDLKMGCEWLVKRIFKKEEILLKKQNKLSSRNIEARKMKINKLKWIYKLLSDKSRKLEEIMPRFMVVIEWNEWEELGKKKQEELEKQKEFGNISFIISWQPSNLSDFEPYMVGKTLAIPDGVFSIDLCLIGREFSDMVEKIKVPESVREISNYCFKGCSKVSEIIFGNADVTFKGDSTFEGCKSIWKIYVIYMGAYDIEFFTQKLYKAGLDKNVEEILDYDMWSIFDLPFLFDEDNTSIAESL